MRKHITEEGTDITAIKPSISLLILRMVAGFFILDTCYALVIILLLWQAPEALSHDWLLGTLLLLHTIKFVILTIFLLRLLVQWQGRTILITNHHLYIDEGLVHAKDRIYELAQIQEIKLNQTWLGKLLNFGDIVITLGSRSFAEVLELNGVTAPGDYVAWFSKYLQPSP